MIAIVITMCVVFPLVAVLIYFGNLSYRIKQNAMKRISDPNLSDCKAQAIATVASSPILDVKIPLKISLKHCVH